MRDNQEFSETLLLRKMVIVGELGICAPRCLMISTLNFADDSDIRPLPENGRRLDVDEMPKCHHSVRFDFHVC